MNNKECRWCEYEIVHRVHLLTVKYSMDAGSATFSTASWWLRQNSTYMWNFGAHVIKQCATSSGIISYFSNSRRKVLWNPKTNDSLWKSVFAMNSQLGTNSVLVCRLYGANTLTRCEIHKSLLCFRKYWHPKRPAQERSVTFRIWLRAQNTVKGTSEKRKWSYPSIHPSIHQSINPSKNQSNEQLINKNTWRINQSINRMIRRYSHTSVARRTCMHSAKSFT